MSEMCAAPKAARQGYYAWRSRPPSAHAMRDAELAELISRVREKVRNIYGAPKRESALDLVGRRFEADGPNMAWFADITYVKTRQGWLRLALVMDIRSRRIVGWSMGPNITAELADEALRMALGYFSPVEFEEANWPTDEGRPKAA